MKKSTLILTTLITLLLLPQNVQAQYATQSECQSNCSSPYSCGYDHGIEAYMCHGSQAKDSRCSAVATYIYPYNSCQYALNSFKARGIPYGSGCIAYGGGYYICKGGKVSSCPSNCSSCSSSSVCTTCDSGYYLSSGSCISCPSNATCTGTSVFTCNSGYTKLNGACVKDTPSNTVNSCPSRMKLSDDGCCCINK